MVINGRKGKRKFGSKQQAASSRQQAGKPREKKGERAKGRQ
jgi:hypothetical protein